jgi:hypothetical protein
VWEQDARDRLRTALDQAFGGTPDGLVVHPAIVRGPPGPALVWMADQPDDLLVVGCGGWGPLGAAGGLSVPVQRDAGPVPLRGSRLDSGTWM